MEIRRNPVFLVLAIMAILVILGLVLLFVSTSSAPSQDSAQVEPSTAPTSAESGTPTTAPDPDAVISSESSTKLRIAVDTCESCQITAQPTGGSVDLQPISATVADGTAEINLPTSSTLGLVFSVRGEQSGEDNPESSLVILSTDAGEPGAPQSQTDLNNAAKGSYCWAGTILDEATVRFSVSGDAASPGSAWADPTLPTAGGKVTLKNGSASVPETLSCS